MSKSSQSREAAKVIVNPLFAWSNAVLKSGEMMLDSMAAATKNAVRVAVLPETDAPRRRPASGKREELLQHFRANVAAVRAEKGCIEYGAAVDADPALPIQKKWGDDTFLVIEKWESMDALKAHAAAPHMAAYGAKTKDLLASRVIHILRPV